MVVFGVEEKSVRSMDMVSERSKALHNFAMPPLRWGNQQFLRCMKVDSRGQISSSFDRRSSASELESDTVNGYLESEKRRSPSGDGGLKKWRSLPLRQIGRVDGDEEIEEIEEIREKLMAHLRNAADKMKFPIPEEGEGDDESAARPWNLRTRRAALKAPSEKSPKLEERVSPQKNENSNTSPKMLRSRGVVESSKERKKFSKDLTREEIEEDFAVMNGTRPSRRPKKRAKNVQNNLDTLFPGFWLSEVTVDTYKIPDEPEKKRSRNS